MPDTFKSYISNPKKQKYVIFAILSLINILVGMIFVGFRNIRDITEETIIREMSLLYIIITLLIVVFYFLLCTYLKSKKKASILRGLFLYQLIGVISFSLYFIFRLLGISEMLTLPQYIFHWWSFFLRPLSLVISRFVHMSYPYIMGLLYVTLTYITALSLSGLIKNVNFEKKIEEKKAFENDSNLKHK